MCLRPGPACSHAPGRPGRDQLEPSVGVRLRTTCLSSETLVTNVQNLTSRLLSIHFPQAPPNIGLAPARAWDDRLAVVIKLSF